MLLVRSGGRFSVLAALIVAGLFLFVVRPAINDTTERAFETADRALEQADDVLAATADGDYLSAASFGAAVREIKAEIGPGGELLDLTVSAEGGGNVKYRTGDRAAGFAWGPGREGLEPVDVTLVGSGRIEDNVFPIAKLSPDATTKLRDAVERRAGADFEIETMTLGLAPVSGDARWTVAGEGDGRQLVFSAKADGSGLRAVN